MSNSKKFVITTRSSELVFVRRGHVPVYTYCAVCRAERQMLTIDDAVTIACAPTREIVAHTETGAIHAAESAGGHLLICPDSLRAFCEERK